MRTMLMSIAAIGVGCDPSNSPRPSGSYVPKGLSRRVLQKVVCVSSGHRLYMHTNTILQSSARHARTGCERRNQPVSEGITQKKGRFGRPFSFPQQLRKLREPRHSAARGRWTADAMLKLAAIPNNRHRYFKAQRLVEKAAA